MAWTASSESGNARGQPWPRWIRDTGDARASISSALSAGDDRSPHHGPDDPRPETAAFGARPAEVRDAAALEPVAEDGEVAGRNVSDPMTETRTTPIVAIAIERNSGSSSRKRPAIEIITARPLKKTARPAVLLAIAMPGIRSCRAATRAGRA